MAKNNYDLWLYSYVRCLNQINLRSHIDLTNNILTEGTITRYREMLFVRSVSLLICYCNSGSMQRKLNSICIQYVGQVSVIRV